MLSCQQQDRGIEITNFRSPQLTMARLQLKKPESDFLFLPISHCGVWYVTNMFSTLQLSKHPKNLPLRTGKCVCSVWIGVGLETGRNVGKILNFVQVVRLHSLSFVSPRLVSSRLVWASSGWEFHLAAHPVWCALFVCILSLFSIVHMAWQANDPVLD